ncbi:DUF624 domain-containing protein [Dorea formicigenerans]|uniref:DUF624 domain-containing protein n=1 Tax=Dorea formicigenerans TaxID=39486 RepID=A0A395XLL5_9FIRM|nr:DUF624 domain-containing protein [Dorea formicigenerans]
MRDPYVRFNGRGENIYFPSTYLGCIPVVTIGASVTAGMYCMSKMHDPESMIITVEYFHAFAVNFKKATLVWILFLFIGFIGAGDLFYAVRVADGGNLFFFLFALILLFVLISVMFWVFLLIGRYENSIQEHLKNALLLAVGRLPRTLLMWIVWGLPVAIVIFYPIWMVPFGWFFITIGVAVLLWMSWLVQRGAVA